MHFSIGGQGLLSPEGEVPLKFTYAISVAEGQELTVTLRTTVFVQHLPLQITDMY